MNELIEHIRKMNEEGRERMAKDPNVWVGMITEDPQHWADYGITTVEQFGDYLDECVQKEYDADNIVEDEVVYYDAPEPTWDAVSRHDMNEGW